MMRFNINGEEEAVAGRISHHPTMQRRNRSIQPPHYRILGTLSVRPLVRMSVHRWSRCPW